MKKNNSSVFSLFMGQLLICQLIARIAKDKENVLCIYYLILMVISWSLSTQVQDSSEPNTCRSRQPNCYQDIIIYCPKLLNIFDTQQILQPASVTSQTYFDNACSFGCSFFLLTGCLKSGSKLPRSPSDASGSKLRLDNRPTEKRIVCCFWY